MKCCTITSCVLLIRSMVAASVLSSFEEFMSGDKVFAYLAESQDILDPVEDKVLDDQLEAYVSYLYTDSKMEEFRNESFENLENDLEYLNDKLLDIYKRLVEFTRIVVSLTDEDILEMANILISKSEYYEKVVEGDGDSDLWKLTSNQKLSGPSQKRQEEVYDNGEDTDVTQTYVELHGEGTFWDPDSVYETLDQYFLEDSAESAQDLAQHKLDSLVQSQGIIKKILKVIKKKKKKFGLLLKLLKLKKKLRLAKLKSILKIMHTIECIKSVTLLLKKYIIKKIKSFIKTFPWNVLWKLKVVIMLFLRIISTILYELKFILLELSIKLFLILEELAESTKDVSQIPYELLIYLRMEIYDRLGVFDSEAEERRKKAWEDWEQNLEVSENSDTIISYGIDESPETRPKEVYEIFKDHFTEQEFKEFDEEYGFNLNISYQFDFENALSSDLSAMGSADSGVSSSGDARTEYKNISRHEGNDEQDHEELTARDLTSLDQFLGSKEFGNIESIEKSLGYSKHDSQSSNNEDTFLVNIPKFNITVNSSAIIEQLASINITLEQKSATNATDTSEGSVITSPGSAVLLCLFTTFFISILFTNTIIRILR